MTAVDLAPINVARINVDAAPGPAHTAGMDTAQRMHLDRIAALVPGPPLGAVEVHGTGGFASAFDVDTALVTAAAAANAAFGVGELDRARVVALASGRVLVDGEPVPVWADLSGYYATRDGVTIQFHANFPHHAAGIVEELGCAPTREAVQEAVLRRDAAELEAALVARGMIAARLRTLAEWGAHPHAAATAGLPLIGIERIGDGAPREPERRLRVLDCSRVLAGPVAGLTFSAHGADVLLVGAAHLPSVLVGVLGTGSGKRNAFVELGTPAGDATFAGLLGGADVWIDSYRPGSFAARGFTPESIAPGGVVVQVSAFDWVGPWAGRRGFDSIVQSTTGIVEAGTAAAGATAPVPLPVQALDYATGLLAAFAARQLVHHQAEVGGTWLARVSLLRTRDWLVSLGGPRPFAPVPPAVDPAAMHTVSTPFGEVTTALPIGGAWPHGPMPLGSSDPTWLDHPHHRM